MNGIAFDREQSRLFAVEGGTNTLIEISFDAEIREIVIFPLLNSGQQAVPAGLAVDPQTGQVTDEITGLTTAVDVAIDHSGNLYMVEMASAYADILPRRYDLFDESASPVHGGYLRFSGRLTLYPASGGPPRVLLEGLDAPTNITLGPKGAIYLSTGEGTP